MDTDAAAVSPRLRAEIAHVLFLDVVGFTRLPMEQQTRLICRLRECVAAASEVQQAQAQNELLCLPTGDGMALAFFQDACAPIRCALQIGEAVRAAPALPLRIGIHTGPVHRVRDMNGAENVTGGGINMAQRIMDCGDAGHILLSRPYAEVLLQFEEWSGCLHDLGVRQIKHGEWVHLFSFHTPALGNAHRPAQMPVARLTQATQLTWAARHVWLSAAFCSVLMFLLLLLLYHARLSVTISFPSGSGPPVYVGQPRGGYR